MKTLQILLVVILSFTVAFATAKYAAPHTEDAVTKESAYERVLHTGELRCGYGVYAPYFTKDASTGAFGGIFYDLTESIAQHLGLKVVWAEELGLGDVPTALETGKIDMYCGGLWTAGKRVKAVDFLKPIAFEPFLIYVRENDHRFDDDLSAVNNPDIKVSAIDGEASGLVASEDFPKAQLVSLPQLSNYAEMFNQVATNKADIVIAAPTGIAGFLKNNPGSLRPIVKFPLREFFLMLLPFVMVKKSYAT